MWLLRKEGGGGVLGATRGVGDFLAVGTVAACAMQYNNVHKDVFLLV